MLFFLAPAAALAVIAAWFAILLTGMYPHTLLGYVVRVLRWSNWVNGYASRS